MDPPREFAGLPQVISTRPYLGVPLHTLVLSTEVLSGATRGAKYEDVRHARDDGGQRHRPHAGDGSLTQLTLLVVAFLLSLLLDIAVLDAAV